MVTVSHCPSLTGGSEKSKIKTIIRFSLDTIPRHDEVKCLTVNININTVSGVSLPEMILHCEIQTRLGTHAPVIPRHKNTNVTQY